MSSVQTVVICVPSPGANVDPCGADYALSTVSAIVIDPSQTVEALDYSSLGAIWIFGFATVVSLWFFAKNMGLILSSIRRF